MVPFCPTATNWPPPYVTLYKVAEVPVGWAVQVAPVGEVTIVPFHPTATYWPAP